MAHDSETVARAAKFYNEAVATGACGIGQYVGTGKVSALTIVARRGKWTRYVTQTLLDAAEDAGLLAASVANDDGELAARREKDAAAAMRRKIATLETQLIAERDWRAKMDGLHAAKLPPADWKRGPALRKSNVLTPILFTSDFQCGEVIKADQIDGINAYDQHIFAERYQRMIEKTLILAKKNTGATEFPGCIYLRGGDAISGEIHAELAETNDLSSVPALRLLQRQEREGIKRLRDAFGRVRVISIPGNHGRTTFKPQAKGYTERSYETLLAWWLSDAFEGDARVTFWTPPSGDALFDVEGYGFLLSHGDRMGSRGGTGFIGPAATVARGHKKLFDNWSLTGRRVDCILTGHLHTSLRLELGFANGALAGYSEYARDLRAKPDAAKQWLLFAHREEMISHQFELRLSPRPTRTAAEPSHEGIAA